MYNINFKINFRFWENGRDIFLKKKMVEINNLRS